MHESARVALPLRLTRANLSRTVAVPRRDRPTGTGRLSYALRPIATADL